MEHLSPAGSGCFFGLFIGWRCVGVSKAHGNPRRLRKIGPGGTRPSRTRLRLPGDALIVEGRGRAHEQAKDVREALVVGVVAAR